MFAALPKLAQAELRADGQRIKYSNGQIVQHRGDTPKNFFLIEKGQVKLGQYDEFGDMKALIMLGVGDSFGEMACLGNFPRISDAEAVGETELLSISEKKFSSVLLESPTVSREVMRVLSRQLQEAMDNLIVYRKLPAPLRLVRSLLLLCDSRTAPVTLSIRHQELAELVGVSRMSIAKTLELLEQLKLIKRGYREIVVTDTDGLKGWMKAQQPN
jgi:CRP/FNR family transcriptional regulator